MRAEEIVASFKKKFGKKIKDARIDEQKHKLGKENSIFRVWLAIESGMLKDAVKLLHEMQDAPHFCACSGYDAGDGIELNYHFTLCYGKPLSEIVVSICTEVPKKNPAIETISDIVPCAILSEREMQEMLGVKISGIPDGRRLFLDESFPKGAYPWRRDEKGVGKMTRNLNEAGKNG